MVTDIDIQKPDFNLMDASVQKSLLNTPDINIRKQLTFAVEALGRLCPQ